jgi:hypothetical protein
MSSIMFKSLLEASVLTTVMLRVIGHCGSLVTRNSFVLHELAASSLINGIFDIVMSHHSQIVDVRETQGEIFVRNVLVVAKMYM